MTDYILSLIVKDANDRRSTQWDMRKAWNRFRTDMLVRMDAWPDDKPSRDALRNAYYDAWDGKYGG